MERIRSVLQAAEEALADLGACEDENCGEPACNHALPHVRRLLAEIRASGGTSDEHLPVALHLTPQRRHVLACPACGDDLNLRQVRIIDGDVEWDMECGRGHVWDLTWDLWRQAGVRVWVSGHGDESGE